jgi:hypothetical protein
VETSDHGIDELFIDQVSGVWSLDAVAQLCAPTDEVEALPGGDVGAMR